MATGGHEHERLRDRFHLPHLHTPHLRHEFRCGTCGYGAVALKAPVRCPMCGGASWTHHR